MTDITLIHMINCEDSTEGALRSSVWVYFDAFDEQAINLNWHELASNPTRLLKIVGPVEDSIATEVFTQLKETFETMGMRVYGYETADD